MIGQWIKESREAKGFSKTALAKALNMTRQNIHHYENGRNVSPSLAALQEFSKVLDLNLIIEKGDVIRMKTESGMVPTIQNLRDSLVRQFQYTSQISLGDFIEQVQTLIGSESKTEAPTFIPFLPAPEIEIEEPELEDEVEAWFNFFRQSFWGRFEFDIELEDHSFIQGITFDFVKPEQFANILAHSASRSLQEFNPYRDETYWEAIIKDAFSGMIWEDLLELKIRKIQIERP